MIAFLWLAYQQRKRFEAQQIVLELARGMKVSGGSGSSKGKGYREVTPDEFLKITGHGAI